MNIRSLEETQLSCLDRLHSQEFLEKLERLGREHASAYQNNAPFPHIYFDDFLPAPVARAALEAFPQPKQLAWQEFNNPNEKKLAFDKPHKLPPAIRDVLYFLNSQPIIHFLETLTGIPGIIADHGYSGGGLHQIKPGGLLEVHVDFNRHSGLQLDRRLNLLLYLNEDWREDYGGHFELWNSDMTRAEVKILPHFNRCTIFSTSEISYHGHPNPLTCPPDRTRKSLATYYYTNGRPDCETADSHSTVFRQRPGTTKSEAGSKAGTITDKILSPTLTKVWRRLRRR